MERLAAMRKAVLHLKRCGFPMDEVRLRRRLLWVKLGSKSKFASFLRAWEVSCFGGVIREGKYVFWSALYILKSWVEGIGNELEMSR